MYEQPTMSDSIDLPAALQESVAADDVESKEQVAAQWARVHNAKENVMSSLFHAHHQCRTVCAWRDTVLRTELMPIPVAYDLVLASTALQRQHFFLLSHMREFLGLLFGAEEEQLPAVQQSVALHLMSSELKSLQRQLKEEKERNQQLTEHSEQTFRNLLNVTNERNAYRRAKDRLQEHAKRLERQVLMFEDHAGNQTDDESVRNDDVLSEPKETFAHFSSRLGENVAALTQRMGHLTQTMHVLTSQMNKAAQDEDVAATPLGNSGMSLSKLNASLHAIEVQMVHIRERFSSVHSALEGVMREFTRMSKEKSEMETRTQYQGELCIRQGAVLQALIDKVHLVDTRMQPLAHKVIRTMGPQKEVDLLQHAVIEVLEALDPESADKFRAKAAAMVQSFKPAAAIGGNTSPKEKERVPISPAVVVTPSSSSPRVPSSGRGSSSSSPYQRKSPVPKSATSTSDRPSPLVVPTSETEVEENADQDTYSRDQVRELRRKYGQQLDVMRGVYEDRIRHLEVNLQMLTSKREPHAGGSLPTNTDIPQSIEAMREQWKLHVRTRNVTPDSTVPAQAEGEPAKIYQHAIESARARMLRAMGHAPSADSSPSSSSLGKYESS
jgi:hypothetical protein